MKKKSHWTYRGLFCAVRVLLLSSLALAVTAASAAEPKLPTPIPKRVLAPNGIVAAKRWCLVHGAPLHRDRDPSSEVLGRVGFMEVVHLAEGYPEKVTTLEADRYRLDPSTRATNNDWALVCIPDPTSPQETKSFRGWIPRRYLTDSLAAERDPETHIQKKAVIRTSKVQGELRAEPVQPLLAPPGLVTDLAGVAPVKMPPKLELYRLLFVYAEYGEWVLVSPDAVQSPAAPQSEHQANVFGWIPQNRLARWNTRECFQWDRETYANREANVGRLFLSAADAIASATSKSEPAMNSLSEPDPRTAQGKVVTLAKDAMRFHLLTNPKEAQQQGKDRNGEWARPVRSAGGKTVFNQLFEVGAVLSDGRVNSRIERDQGRLETLANESSDIEILFVIDDTGSMHVAFKVVADVVVQISESLSNPPTSGDVRIGICYYHDGNSVEQAVDTTTTLLASITKGDGLKQRVQQLNVHEVIEDPLDDPLERMFDGISQGIKKAGFKSHSRKIVILIGDCGEKGTSKASLKDLVAQLIPTEESPIEFHAIQLKDPKKNKDYETFQRQIQVDLRTEYVKRLGERLKTVAATLESGNAPVRSEKLFSYSFIDTPFAGDPDIRVITDHIAKQVLPNTNEARAQGDLLRQALRSFVTTAKLDVQDIAEAGIATPVFFKQILKDEGLESYGQSPQLYKQMYAWELNSAGQRQLKRMVFVEDTNILRAIKALTDLEARLREGQDPGADQAIVKILAEQIGSSWDVPPELTSDRDRASWLLKMLSFKSDLFVKLMDPAKGKPTLADYSKVFLKRRLLEAIQKKRRTTPSDYEEKPVSETSQYREWQLKKDLTTYDVYDRGFPRFYNTGSESNAQGVLWYYIDYYEEWP